MKAFALHYSPPRAPVYFRFRSPGDRDAWATQAPDYRRACPEPPPSPAWTEDRVSLEGGRVLPVSYRTATMNDLVPVSPEPVVRHRKGPMDLGNVDG